MQPPAPHPTPPPTLTGAAYCGMCFFIPSFPFSSIWNRSLHLTMFLRTDDCSWCPCFFGGVCCCFCAGGPSVPWHLGLHDGPGGDRGSGEDVPWHRKALARQLRPHGSDPSVRVAASDSAAQGLPAGSQGKAGRAGTCWRCDVLICELLLSAGRQAQTRLFWLPLVL